LFAALVLATQLLAGTAKLDITPLNNGFRPCTLVATSRRGDSPATGTAKPLFLRALALRQDGEVRVVVALDVLGVPRRMYDDVLAATHLPPATYCWSPATPIAARYFQQSKRLYHVRHVALRVGCGPAVYALAHEAHD